MTFMLDVTEALKFAQAHSTEQSKRCIDLVNMLSSILGYSADVKAEVNSDTLKITVPDHWFLHH